MIFFFCCASSGRGPTYMDHRRFGTNKDSGEAEWWGICQRAKQVALRTTLLLSSDAETCPIAPKNHWCVNYRLKICIAGFLDVANLIFSCASVEWLSIDDGMRCILIITVSSIRSSNRNKPIVPLPITFQATSSKPDEVPTHSTMPSTSTQPPDPFEQESVSHLQDERTE